MKKLLVLLVLMLAAGCMAGIGIIMRLK